jgi:hypothetical protein
MSIAGPLFGATVDAIVAACGSTLAVDSARVFQAVAPEANAQLPFVVVRLPQQGKGTGDWGGTGNLRNNDFKVEVCLAAEIPSGITHPYGDASTPGILTLTDDLMNVLENAKAAFLASTPKLIDYQLTAESFTKDDSRVGVSVLTLIFKTRFFAGQR